MTSKRRRKKEDRRSRRKALSKKRSKRIPDAPDALPTAFRRSVDRWNRLITTLGVDADFDAEVERRWHELEDVLAPVDAVDMIGQLVLSETASDPNSYVESESDGSAHVVELCAAVLAMRDNREALMGSGIVPDGNTLEPARELIHELALLEGIRRHRHASSTSSDPGYGNARGRAAMAHLMLRGPGWPWQETAVLRELFAPYASQLVRQLGFDADQACACADAVPELVRQQLVESVRAPVAVTKVEAWALGAVGGWQQAPPSKIRDRALTALYKLTKSGDTMAISPARLSAAASVPESAASSFLEVLSTEFGQPRDLFRAGEHVRSHPFLKLPGGRYLLTVPGNDLWALRSLFEQAVRGEAYSRVRGKWLERRSLDLLETALKPDEAYLGVDVIAPDGVTKLGEIDGLLRFGDAAVILEAKSATMKPGARRGGEALIGHLKATLTKAADQAGLALDVLRGDREAALHHKGEELTLGERINEVQPVLVTLDDLSAVAPVVWELAGSAVLPAGVTTPWIVTLHELDLVAQTVESPIQFLHFLHRRSRLNELGGKVAHDELDWWMLYLTRGLYFDDERADKSLRYLSQTDALDAWVLYEQGLREDPSPKPRQDLDEHTQAVLDLLNQERPAGWVTAGRCLLTASGESAHQIGRDTSAARRRASDRNRAQRACYGYLDEPDPMLICWVVAPDSGANQLGAALQSYVTDRLADHDGEPPPVAAFAVTSSSDRAFDAVLTVK